MSIVQNVCKALERIAPLRLAEKWDNVSATSPYELLGWNFDQVGLIIEAPQQRSNANRVLLTIDLTPAVVAEALSTPTAFIVSYHPPIFKPLSALTLANPLQASLLRCAAAGISVYTPHTALDSVIGGINDWLCLGLNNQLIPNRESLRYIGDPDSEGLGGLGRVLKFQKPVSMQELQRRIKSHLQLEHIEVAYTAVRDLDHVQSVAVCAGSGGSILLDVDADVYFTGEMQHHEVLAAIGSGHNVVLCGHTNTERGYLHTLADKLTPELTIESASEGPVLEVHVSKQDAHPLQIV